LMQIMFILTCKPFTKKILVFKVDLEKISYFGL